MKLFDNTKIGVLANALDAYTLRHKVISSNIANIGTPGYRAKAVEFESALSTEMARTTVASTVTNARHIEIGSADPAMAAPKVVDAAPNGFSEEDMKSGINDVDIDSEMAEMAKNQIRFKYVSKLLGNSFMSLQKSIKGQV